MSITSRREREKEQRREAILLAARSVFLKNGYIRTTMGEVAKAAELSKGTLYLYFESKFEIYSELSDRVCVRILSGFKGVSEQKSDGRQMVGEMLAHWVAVSSSDLKHFRLVVEFIASDDLPDTAISVACHRKTVVKIIDQLASAVKTGQNDNSILRKTDSVTIACQLWAAMVGAMLFHSRSQKLMELFPVTVDSTNFMNNQIELLCAGLGVEQ